ncbi:hypothetical protein [Cupriavidus sp. EM10]|uniref:hypothetical protein n=1 Tax=Cupriavidus sp. EM10 TaxID=2839983 RepID=UPI001BFFFE1A|nr:hypothetical protein [Cupriavidus sp. EM10]QWE96099.1 hypothetical protein KLP38_08425 [Cupriavidus sp. EM10]
MASSKPVAVVRMRRRARSLMPGSPHFVPLENSRHHAWWSILPASTIDSSAGSVEALKPSSRIVSSLRPALPVVAP